MSGNRFRNFDEMLEEVTERPIVVRLLGRKWELPASVPAFVILRAQRVRALGFDLVQRAKENPEVADTDLPMMREALSFDFREELTALVGEEIAQTWLADERLTYPKLQEIYWEIVAMYESPTQEGDDEPESDEGEEPAPTPGPQTASPQPTSSSPGPSSKPISSASTPSTSPPSSDAPAITL